MTRPGTSLRPARRRPVLTAALACALGTLAALAAAPARAEPPAPAHVVRDPYYGEVLYQYFQDQYFTALTELMAAQGQGRLSHHDDEAEVLRGGLLLSYGLHRQAGEIFEQLIARHARPDVQDRAWYFLARVRYQRGLDADAEAALDKIAHPLPEPLEEQRQLMKAQLQMARGDFAGATRGLSALVHPASATWFSSAPPVSLYARYNLGIAQVRGGDVARGTAVLDAIGTMPGPDEETRALRDRANVALGFAALQAGKPQEARRVLERVRLQGPSANKALLGFGWAAASLKHYDDALVPWTELTTRDADDAAVLEARIAVPYAYGELGASRQALALYQDALAAFDREHAALADSITALRQGALVPALAERNTQPARGWQAQDIALLPPALPHPGHLAAVLAQNDFQEGFHAWRDLQFLARNLSGWREQLGIFDDMLANRRQGYAERLPRIHARSGTLDVDALQKRYDALAAEVAQAERDADGRALANDAERALMTRADHARELLEKAQAAGGDPSLDAARERLRLVQGALAWQLAQAQTPRLWDAKKGLRATAGGLAQGREQEAELARAERDEPRRFGTLSARIAALRQRLDVLSPRVAALSAEEQRALQDLAIAALQQQQERLAGYSAQARVAIAQLYDQATRQKAGGGGSAAPAGTPVPSSQATPAPAAAPVRAPAPTPTPAPAPAPAARPPAPAPAPAPTGLGITELNDPEPAHAPR